MSNPFITSVSGTSSKVKVNKISADVLGNIAVPLSSLTDCVIVTESLANGQN